MGLIWEFYGKHKTPKLNSFYTSLPLLITNKSKGDIFLPNIEFCDYFLIFLIILLTVSHSIKYALGSWNSRGNWDVPFTRFVGHKYAINNNKVFTYIDRVHGNTLFCSLPDFNNETYTYSFWIEQLTNSNSSPRGVSRIFRRGGHSCKLFNH